MGMNTGWQEQLRPGVALRGIVQQATAALIAMDSQRLEELAQCCADLIRELEGTGITPEAEADLRDSARDVKLLNRILFETRANLAVFSRLHVMRKEEAAAWQIQERNVTYGDN
jgi:hypothetical protein